MPRTSRLAPILAVGAITVFAVPAYGQYANIYVQQDTSTDNVSAGFDANTSDGGVQNTAFGFFALDNNGCCGYYNSAFGYSALQNNSLGGYNTAIGYSALFEEGNGSQNTAAGANAMFWNTGSNNSAVGYNAMEQNSTGSYNTAVGYQSLGGNIDAPARQTGNDNTAVGADAMYSNESGNNNTASGYKALYHTTIGVQNTGIGASALVANTSGEHNTAIGTYSLNSNTTGGTNIALGYKAGYNISTGSNNIDIGNQALSGDSNIIRIGVAANTATYIAGISGASVAGVPVYVSSAGQLGVATSSERFKTDIAPMGANTAKLEELRPVTFHYKSEPHGTLQYGLIAEEVAKVYPDLVVRDANGHILSVRYDELAPMLLDVAQKQLAAKRAQDREIVQQSAAIARQSAEIEELKAAVRAMGRHEVLPP